MAGVLVCILVVLISSQRVTQTFDFAVLAALLN